MRNLASRGLYEILKWNKCRLSVTSFGRFGLFQRWTLEDSLTPFLLLWLMLNLQILCWKRLQLWLQISGFVPENKVRPVLSFRPLKTEVCHFFNNSISNFIFQMRFQHSPQSVCKTYINGWASVTVLEWLGEPSHKPGLKGKKSFYRHLLS